MTNIPSYDVRQYYEDIRSDDLTTVDDKHTKAVEAIHRFWKTKTESDYKHAVTTQRELVSVFYGKRFYSG